MKNPWPAILFAVTACTRTVVVHDPVYVAPTGDDAEVQVSVESEPPPPTDDVFALAARMIESSPPPVTLSPALAVHETARPSPAPTYVEPVYDGAYGGAGYGGATYGGEVASVPTPSVTTPSVTTPSTSPVVQDHAVLIAFLRSIRATHDFDSVSLRFAGHSSPRSWMAARASGGGYFVAATRRAPTKRNEYAVVPNVIRIDAAGQVLWTGDVGESGFATFEVPDLLATPDGGVLVHVLAYKHPARNGNQRFVKLDRDGHREWAVQLPGGVDTDAPHVNFMLPDTKGAVVLSGYWVRSSELTSKHDWSGHLREWRGRLESDGRLSESSVGEVLADEKLRPWPDQNPVGDAVAAP